MTTINEMKKYDSKKYEETGFLFPIDVVGFNEIIAIRKDFELAENELADDPVHLSLLRSYPAQFLSLFVYIHLLIYFLHIHILFLIHLHYIFLLLEYFLF